MSLQREFGFMAPLPPRPDKPERLFLGVFPEKAAAARLTKAGEEVRRLHGLTGRLLAADRLHLSLIHLSDRKRIRSRDIFAAELAAKAVVLPPFTVTLSGVGSFHGAPKRGRPMEHPLVMLAEEGEITALRGTLAAEFRKLGFPVPEPFRPHVTLIYDSRFVSVHAVEPITFAVRELLLVHSRLWLTEYHILRTWTLH